MLDSLFKEDLFSHGLTTGVLESAEKNISDLEIKSPHIHVIVKISFYFSHIILKRDHTGLLSY